MISWFKKKKDNKDAAKPSDTADKGGDISELTDIIEESAPIASDTVAEGTVEPHMPDQKPAKPIVPSAATSAGTKTDKSSIDGDNVDDESASGWTARLTGGLSKSSTKLTTGITDIFTKRKLDDDTVDELEELLITADMGPITAAKLAANVAKSRFGKDVTPDEIRGALADEIAQILAPVAKPMNIDPDLKPAVILVVGVNGTGKTTTIAKLAEQYNKAGKKVVLAAGDTFRAAAVEQLQIWGKRTNATVVAKEIGADAAAVTFEAIDTAKREGADVVLIDTAGRLHNKSNLMDELAKIHRIIQKQMPEAPHATIITLDATTGQNAINQVDMFNKTTPLTGLVVTKLDGSAKGGVVVSLAEKFNLPIHAIGIGEGADDLRPFDANEFADALVLV